jgi:DNA-3-methyladenine glycosylase II
LIAAGGPIHISRRMAAHFAALVEAIVYQQLAGAAARAIHGRLILACTTTWSPKRCWHCPMRHSAVGLSTNKLRSLRDLATKVLDGTVILFPRDLSGQSEDEVVARLSTVRGIGPWTAHPLLMFQLRRLDVWPVVDLGVRHGYGFAWEVPTPTPRELEPLGEPYRPYRTVVAWYCWRTVELYADGADSAFTR